MKRKRSDIIEDLEDYLLTIEDEFMKQNVRMRIDRRKFLLAPGRTDVIVDGVIRSSVIMRIVNGRVLTVIC